MKRNSILTSTLSALGIAAAIFCIMVVVFDILNKGSFHTESYSITKMAIGTLAVGLGFGLPTIVYKNDNMPVAMRALLHMGIGCVVMTITAFIVGWVPVGMGAGAVIGTIIGEIAVAFIVWLLFYAKHKRLAAQMNQKIAENH